MEPHISTWRLHDRHFRPQAEAFFRLRYRVFHQRLRWQVQEHDGMERDVFDDPQALYLTATDAAGQVCGGWRLRPTTAPYMLATVFPQLLHGAPPPARSDVWEISRFAVEDPQYHRGIGFGATARALIRQSIFHAADTGITAYVLVVSLGVERLLRMLGLRLHRFGPPLLLGRVRSVACRLRIDADALAVACSLAVDEEARSGAADFSELQARFAA